MCAAESWVRIRITGESKLTQRKMLRRCVEGCVVDQSPLCPCHKHHRLKSHTLRSSYPAGLSPSRSVSRTPRARSASVQCSS